ncbi:MAG: hypothetical protein QXI02_02980 [Candidatus Caldarchaeum sp.]
MSKFEVRIFDLKPPEVVSGLPEPTGLTAKPRVRGAEFYWSQTEDIKPNRWQYRTKVGDGPWGDWQETLFPRVIRTMTPEEQEAYGPTATITIQVRSTDGEGNYSQTFSASCQAQVVRVVGDDIEEQVVGLGHLDSPVLGRMFSTDERSGADLKDGSIEFVKMGPTAQARMFDNTERVAKDTEKVGGVLSSIVAAQAAAGQQAKDKIDNDVGEETIESTSGAQAKVDERLSATEKSRLVSDQSIVDGAPLMVRRSEDLQANRSYLNITNVENKSSAQIRAELTEEDLINADGVTQGNLVESVNYHTGEISGTVIDKLKASKVYNDGLTVQLFDSDGNLVFGGSLGIKDVGSNQVRTPSNIVSAISSAGRSVNLDLSSIAAGNLDNIPQTGTYKAVTLGEKAGAARAWIALDENYRLVTGTENYTVSEIENSVNDYYIDFAQGLVAGSYALSDIPWTQVEPDGSDQLIGIFPLVVRKGSVRVKFRVWGNWNGVGNAKLKIRLCNENGGSFDPDVWTQEVCTGGDFIYELELVIPTNEVQPGGWIQLRVYQVCGIGGVLKWRNFRVWSLKE